MAKLDLAPPPSVVDEFDYTWRTWLESLYNRLNNGPTLAKGYTVATVPSAAEWSDGTTFSAYIYVSDETGGATIAFSDGTNWRRVQDRAIIA